MNFNRTIDRTFKQNNINNINLEYIQQKQNTRLETRLDIFEKVLQRVYHRVDICSDYQQNFCFFIIPDYIYGLPIYNVKSCAAYIMKKLMTNGLRCKFFIPNLLYVYWYYKETNPALLAPGMPVNEKYLKNKEEFPDANLNYMKTMPLRTANSGDIDITLPEDRLKYIATRSKNGGDKQLVNIPLPPINMNSIYNNIDSDESEDNNNEIMPPALANNPHTFSDFTISLSDRNTPKSKIKNNRKKSSNIIRSTKDYRAF